MSLDCCSFCKHEGKTMQNETSQRVFIKFEKVSTIWNNLSLNNHHATYLTIGCLNTTKIYKTLVHIQNNFYSLKRRHTANQKKLENTLLVLKGNGGIFKNFFCILIGNYHPLIYLLCVSLEKFYKRL